MIQIKGSKKVHLIQKNVNKSESTVSKW